MNHETTRSRSVSHRIVVAAAALVWIQLGAPSASGQVQLWARQLGTPETDHARALAPDGTGGVYIAGDTIGSLGGPYTGIRNAFLAHYDGAGTQIWITRLDGPRGSRGNALIPDGVGGVYIAGDTGGGFGGPHAGGSTDGFVAHYDRAGTQTWIAQFGTHSNDFARAIAPDGVGGLYLAGETEGEFIGSNAGQTDIYIMHINSEHNQTWVRQMGSEGSDIAYALVSDGVGGVYLGGYTGKGLVSEVRMRDAFLAHYDITGAQTWLRQFGTPSSESLFALASDGAGGVYVAGGTGGDLGGHHSGNEDAYLARYDSAGTRTWITQFGTARADNALALASDGLGGVFITGQTRGDLAAVNAGSADIYLAHYSSAGVQTWIGQFGSDENDTPRALAFDGSSGVYVAGGTTGSFGGTHAGGYDAFLARYVAPAAPCYPDCDQSTGSGVLDVLDFLCFQNSFVTGDPYACDCDLSTGPAVCDVWDFICFHTAFSTGCP